MAKVRYTNRHQGATMGLAARRRREDDHQRYRAPPSSSCLFLQELIRRSGRTVEDKQFDLLRSYGAKDAHVYCAGDLSLLMRPTVSVVGTREVSDDGWRRASRLARELAMRNVVVMSGLARGVDTAALTAALEAGGKTIGVIGTPLEKAYPAENAKLQETIYSDHLLISPFRCAEPVYKGNFPKRNRVMALLSDATVIVEASDTSGTLHQAAECLRQGRWLFIVKSVVDDPSLKWPAKFVGKSRVIILTSTSEIVDAVSESRPFDRDHEKAEK
jgi:DNA processing protein